MPNTMAALVEAIHAAGVHADAWPGVIERIRDRFDARIATLGQHEFAGGVDTTLYEAPAGAGFGRELARYGARNPWFLSSDDYADGRVMTGEELIGAQELRRTDFYRGLLEPRGLAHLLCGVIVRQPQSVHCIAAYRTAEQSAFGLRERTELQRLLRHLALSLESRWRMQEAEDLSRALLTLTAQEAHAALLVAGDGEIVWHNPAAELLLAHAQGLRLERGRLVAATQADRRLLAETLERLADAVPSSESSSGADAASPPAVLSLAAPALEHPVVALVRAAGPVYSRQAGRRRGLAMVAVRGAQAHDPATCVFAQRYELTAAQARVSALVFAGQPLASIARTLNLSENTVRSHLKQIFQKTATHGQMELVHLHARVCPALP